MAKSKPENSKSKNSPFEKFYAKKPADELSEVPFKKTAKTSQDPRKKTDTSTTSLDSKIQKRLSKLKGPEVEVTEAPVEIESMRLNKFLAHAGIASRRKADELIAEGKVQVNGEVIKEMGRVRAEVEGAQRKTQWAQPHVQPH